MCSTNDVSVAADLNLPLCGSNMEVDGMALWEKMKSSTKPGASTSMIVSGRVQYHVTHHLPATRPGARLEVGPEHFLNGTSWTSRARHW